MSPYRGGLVAALVFTSIHGCGSARKDPAADPPASTARAGSEDAAKPAGSVARRAAADRQLAIAREKLREAQADVVLQEAAVRDAAQNAAAELDLAKAELAQFDERDAPSRLSNAKLDLQDARDALSEQKEELEQLEATYAGGDLGDKTREIVLNRGKRRVSRAEARLAIQDRETSTLEQLTLPRERRKLELAYSVKQVEIAGATRSAEKEALSKRIAVMSAEAELVRLEAELASPASSAKP